MLENHQFQLYSGHPQKLVEVRFAPDYFGLLRIGLDYSGLSELSLISRGGEERAGVCSQGYKDPSTRQRPQKMGNFFKRTVRKESGNRQGSVSRREVGRGLRMAGLSMEH